MKDFIKEFKEFAVKGNVVDLAVAVVIGGAFGKIVSSLVTNIITPIIGVILGGVDFSGLAYTFDDSNITYGVFIQSIIDFLIVAVVIFMVVKGINKLKSLTDKSEPEKASEKPVEPPEEVKLLREIRDSLKR